jgi:hypothetical protein
MIKSGPEGPLFFVGRGPAGLAHDADARLPSSGLPRRIMRRFFGRSWTISG